MKPQISIINSLSRSGLADTAPLVKRLGVQYVDLYAFMQPDLQLLWPNTRVRPGLPRNTLYEMAEAFHISGEIERVGKIIARNVAPAKIAAFATYLPEITSPASEIARQALRFLIRLASFLRQSGHPVQTIEIVGGSTVDGLWRGRMKGGAPTYVVNRIDESLALTRLVKALRPVIEEAASNSIKLALELEPGPLFTVGNKESLLKFCQLVDEMDTQWKKVIGLNLDIPHWCFLSNIDLDWVQKHPIIRDRITHAHVCDHSRGHFCDVEPLLFHPSSDFVPWLRLLSDLAGQDQSNNSVGYSKFISCELECCGGIDYALRTIHNLEDLINRHCN